MLWRGILHKRYVYVCCKAMTIVHRFYGTPKGFVCVLLLGRNNCLFRQKSWMPDWCLSFCVLVGCQLFFWLLFSVFLLYFKKPLPDSLHDLSLMMHQPPTSYFCTAHHPSRNWFCNSAVFCNTSSDELRHHNREIFFGGNYFPLCWIALHMKRVLPTYTYFLYTLCFD